MKLYNVILSGIRTAVPLGIGVLVSWLAAHGITVDDTTTVALDTGIGALAALVYYNAVRAGESRWPWLGWLIGVPIAPTYRRLHRERH
jgi:uncharacterized membrane protein (DUF441 family)